MLNSPDRPLTAAEVRTAVRAVASRARDAADGALLLDALGLDAVDGVTPIKRPA